MMEIGAELKAIEKEKKDIEEYVEEMSTKFDHVLDMQVSKCVSSRTICSDMPFSKRRTSCGMRRDLIRSREISRKYWIG